MKNTSIKPGQPWLDNNGTRIQAHGGSIMYANGKFYWYGENKEKTLPGTSVWHWGVRCYSSEDLYNWTDEGLICPPVLDDPKSPLYPKNFMDRPHILYNDKTKKFVLWMKIMAECQYMTIATADTILGPYQIIDRLTPLDMSSGDFDLVKDPETGKAYIYFEKVHTELICADLTDDYTNVTGKYSSHFPLKNPPFVREAPAFFRRNGKMYLFTSGTTGYFPNPSQVAEATDYHGPWTCLGDPHVDDLGHDSYCSQITSVFKHPLKKDLYIALADRWLVDLPEDLPSIPDIFERLYDPDHPEHMTDGSILNTFTKSNTSIADYVWLPVIFEGDMPTLKWMPEWRIEDFD